MSLPGVFVWTRFGTEAGQSIEDIIERKEHERIENDGVFLWGVGNNIAPSLPMLLGAGQKPKVVFSPIKSKPRAVDEEPGHVAMWRRATTPAGGRYEIPSASLVTSRYIPGKSKHFALVCRSHHPLTLRSTGDAINLCDLVNAKSGNRIGFSQVTAVVKLSKKSNYYNNNYDIILNCDLDYPFVVTLHDPLVFASDNQCKFAKNKSDDVSDQFDFQLT